jgi:hypothetical protein
MLLAAHARSGWLPLRPLCAADGRDTHPEGDSVTSTAGDKVYTAALALTCAVFFWSAAATSDWLAGVAAGIFLSALIINLSGYPR